VLDKKLEVYFFSIEFFNFLNFISLDQFLEKPFYEEALELTRGYKPITDKLVEPIQPLQVDPTSKFNTLSLLGAQVSLLFPKKIFFFIIK
jgi:hypothetical protein